MPIRQTRVALNTTTGTQDITIAGIGTPKAAIFILQNASTDDTITANANISFGFTDGTRTAHSLTTSQDGVATSNCRRRTGDNVLGITYTGTSTIVTNFMFDSWITDGIRINITTANGDDVFATVIFFYGADILNVYTDLVQLTSTNVNVTAPNFEPDLVIVGSNGDANQDLNGTNAIQGLGFGINDGSDTNAGLLYFDRTSQATSSSGQYLTTAGSAGQYFNGTLSYQTSVQSYDSQGFSFVSTASTGNDYVIYLAVEFDNLSTSLSVVDGPTVTGNASYNVGFEPFFSFHILSGTLTTDAGDVTAAGDYAVFTADATNNYSAVYASQDAVGTMNANCLSASNKIKDLVDGDTLRTEGTFTGFTSSAIGFNFTTVPGSAHKWVQLAIGTTATGITIPCQSTTFSYTAQNATIDLTGEITIPGQATTFSYTAQNATIQTIPAIVINCASATFNYAAQSATLDLIGQIDLNLGSTTYSYTANAASIALQGEINLPLDNTNFTYQALASTIQVVPEVTFTVSKTIYAKGNDRVINVKSSSPKTIQVKR